MPYTNRKMSQCMGTARKRHPTMPSREKIRKSAFLPLKSASVPKIGEMSAVTIVTAEAVYPQ